MKQGYLKCVAKYFSNKGITIDQSKRRQVSYIAKLISGYTGKRLPKNLNYFKYSKIIKTFMKENKITFDIIAQSKKEKTYNKALPPDYSIISKKFYLSPEWRSLRYEVLKEQGARCCLCGRTAKDGVKIHVDHIVPLSKDWSKHLDKGNLQVLCEDCNLGKSNKDCIDWR